MSVEQKPSCWTISPPAKKASMVRGSDQSAKCFEWKSIEDQDNSRTNSYLALTG